MKPESKQSQFSAYSILLLLAGGGLNRPYPSVSFSRRRRWVKSRRRQRICPLRRRLQKSVHPQEILEVGALVWLVVVQVMVRHRGYCFSQDRTLREHCHLDGSGSPPLRRRSREWTQSRSLHRLGRSISVSVLSLGSRSRLCSQRRTEVDICAHLCLDWIK